MKKLTALMAALLLSGCVTTVPKVVKVPVPVPCPAPPQSSRPHLPLSYLRSDAKPDEVIRAYAESIETLGGYAEELETDLKGYRKK